MTDELPIDTVRRFCAAWGVPDLGMFMSQMPQG